MTVTLISIVIQVIIHVLYYYCSSNYTAVDNVIYYLYLCREIKVTVWLITKFNDMM